mgnify:FL=1
MALYDAKKSRLGIPRLIGLFGGYEEAPARPHGRRVTQVCITAGGAAGLATALFECSGTQWPKAFQLVGQDGDDIGDLARIEVMG